MKLLRIDASAGGKNSSSRGLADHLTAHLSTQHAPLYVVRRDLAEEPPPLLSEELVTAFNTPDDERTESQRAQLEVSMEPIRELRDADAIIIATPIYNFGIPAALKAWIDLVVRARETFRYMPEGPQGLLEKTPAYLVITSGGTEIDSEIDFATPYLRHILQFIGIEDIKVFAADSLMRGGAEKVNLVVEEITRAVAPDEGGSQ
ncbi:MAG: FMN-dependent NADH-azoreductase [Myxococcota bacterium]|jgi:FMN-dependent NADH-azoreductase